ncbi:MAG: LytTR family transcriptional regulator [Shimia sp.]|uniref:LytTR family DNA-binding domain-containing protein n=1 Tax=Shimia sp. TaxID=1954381 RepID=UPI003B8E0725
MISQKIALTPQMVKTTLIASAAGAVVVLVLQPEHTSSLPILAAYGLWVTHLFFGSLLFLSGVAGFQRLGWPRPWPTIVSTLLLPILFGCVSMALDYGFGNPEEGEQEAATFLGLLRDEIVAITPASFVIAGALIYLLRGEPSPRDTLVSPVSPDAPKTVALRSLIATAPAHLGDDIIRIHAQDHYVEVVTTQGRSLLSEQFGECVEKLADLDGIHCHRSHWVRLSHVVEIKKKGSAYMCLLSNGDEAPISRRKYAEIKTRMRALVAARVDA